MGSRTDKPAYGGMIGKEYTAGYEELRKQPDMQRDNISQLDKILSSSALLTKWWRSENIKTITRNPNKNFHKPIDIYPNQDYNINYPS